MLEIEYIDKMLCVRIWNLDIVLQFDDWYFFPIPYVWKLYAGFVGEQAKYYGHTWAFTLSWLWFEIGVTRLV